MEMETLSISGTSCNSDCILHFNGLKCKEMTVNQDFLGPSIQLIEMPKTEKTTITIGYKIEYKEWIEKRKDAILKMLDLTDQMVFLVSISIDFPIKDDIHSSKILVINK
jgi:hypothetical protein